MKLSLLAAALGFGLLMSGPTFATDAAAPAASPSPSGAMMMKPDRAAIEARKRECSKEADARGLHLGPRKKFRAKCMKGVK